MFTINVKTSPGRVKTLRKRIDKALQRHIRAALPKLAKAVAQDLQLEFTNNRRGVVTFWDRKELP